MAKDLAICLSDGGLNAAVATALAAQKYRPVLVHVDLGAAGASRATAAYDQQVAHFKPLREYTLPMPFLSALAQARPPGAAGTSAAAVAAAVAANDPRHPAPLGPRMVELLPLVSVATTIAAQHQAAAVYLGLRVGAKGDELAQATEYLQVWNELIQMSCGLPDLELVAPLLELDPWQVVDLGVQVAAPLERTWSCLADGAEPCGACRGCRDREAAFQQAAKLDPARRVGR